MNSLTALFVHATKFTYPTSHHLFIEIAFDHLIVLIDDVSSFFRSTLIIEGKHM